MRLLRAISTLAPAAACVLLAVVAIAAPAPGPTTHESITGTLWRIDSRAGTFDLITGVGHALRLRRVHFADGLHVKAAKAEVGVAGLVPGTVCRVQCDVTAGMASATAVEVIRSATARTP